MDTGTLVSLLGEGLLQTLYMTLLGTLMSYVIGLPIGVSLIVTGPNGIRPLAIYRHRDQCNDSSPRSSGGAVCGKTGGAVTS